MPRIPDQDPSANPGLERRFRKTLRFMLDVAPPPADVIDLGPPNMLVRTEKWTFPTPITGIRPVIRWFVPGYFAVYAERSA